MFTPDEIRDRVRQRPFMPLRIVTSAAQTFDIYHPDLIMIGRRSLIIGTAGSRNPWQYELSTRVAIMHVTALEDLPQPNPPAGQGNGSD